MKYFLSAIIACCFFIACKKDKAPTKTELLTKSSWKYESGGVDQDRNGTVDISFAATGLLQPCILDNFGIFVSNGTGTSDEGATKCTPTAPQTAAFTWNFLNNEQNINISGSGLFGLGGQFKITTLTDVKFGISKDTTINLTGTPQTVGLIINLQH